MSGGVVGLSVQLLEVSHGLYRSTLARNVYLVSALFRFVLPYPSCASLFVFSLEMFLSFFRHIHRNPFR